MSGSVLGVLRTLAKLAYDDNVGCLLGIGQLYLKSIQPNKGLALQDILKKYNSDVGKEIVRFGEQLQTEVGAVLEKLEGSREMPSAQAVLNVIDKFVDPELYPKRLTLFTQAIERRMKSFGVNLDLKEHRIDIPESLAQVGAMNLYNKIRQRIEYSVDKLNLTTPKPQVSVPVEMGTYGKINQAYEKHPVIFWLVGLVIPGIVGVLLL